MSRAVELRSLHYFAAACRAGSFAQAAQSLGIAASTLSAALKALERDCGHPLFARIDTSLHPTPYARNLLRRADALLLAERATRLWMTRSRETALQKVIVELHLTFTIGGVSQAFSHAAALLGAEYPHVLVEPVWRDARNGVDTGSPTAPGSEQASIVISLDTNRTRAPGVMTLLADPWVFARRLPAGTPDRLVAFDLSRERIVVPHLARLLVDQAHSYFSRHGVRGVRFLPDHPGDLPRIVQDHPDALLFLPASLITPRLGLVNVVAVKSPHPLKTYILARPTAPGIIATRFIRLMKHALKDPTPVTLERPVITRREVNYFTATDRVRRVSIASKLIGISQPALSEQLQKLEGALGTPLFVRQGDGLIPTRDGERFTSAAGIIETQFARLLEGVTTTRAPAMRRIALGVLPSVHQHGYLINRIAEALVDVHERRPTLQLTVLEAPNAVLQDWVLRGTVGIAIVETTLPHMPRLPLGSSEALAAFVDPRHDLLPSGPVTLTDLLQRKLAVPTRRFGLRQLLDAAAEDRDLRLDPFIEIDALSMIAAMLARLPVCAVLPPSAMERETASGELSLHPIIEPTIERKLFVIYSGDRPLGDAERDLVTTLRRKLAERRRG